MREEDLKVEIKIPHEFYLQYKEDVEKLITNLQMTTIPGDCVTVSYRFFCEYFGNIEQRMQALIRLLKDNRLPMTATLKELKGLQCLFAELIKAIEARDVPDRPCSTPGQ